MAQTNDICVESKLLSSLKWRYATQKFDPNKKIDARAWQQIEEALILTPSSWGLQAWKFIVVTDPNLKQELVKYSRRQRQPADCSHLVILCRINELTADYIERYVDFMAQTRNVSVGSLAKPKKMMLDLLNLSSAELDTWLTYQVYIALGNLLTSAAILGIDACPMEGFDLAGYDQVLELPAKGCRSVVICPLGYRSTDDEEASLAKVRFPASQLMIRI